MGHRLIRTKFSTAGQGEFLLDVVLHVIWNLLFELSKALHWSKLRWLNRRLALLIESLTLVFFIHHLFMDVVGKVARVSVSSWITALLYIFTGVLSIELVLRN